MPSARAVARRRQHLVVEVTSRGAGMTVGDFDPLRHLRQLRADRRDAWRKLGGIHHDRRVGVVEQIDELVIDVPIVDVDVRQARLERRRDAFAVLRAIAHIERDLVARPRAVASIARARLFVRREKSRHVHDVVGVDQRDAFRRHDRIDRIQDVAVIPSRHEWFQAVIDSPSNSLATLSATRSSQDGATIAQRVARIRLTDPTGSLVGCRRMSRCPEHTTFADFGLTPRGAGGRQTTSATKRRRRFRSPPFRTCWRGATSSARRRPVPARPPHSRCRCCRASTCKRTDPQILVLTPTRELAIQVAEAFQSYASHLRGFHVLPVYGGQDYAVQLRQLKRGVHVIVGTPGSPDGPHAPRHVEARLA